MIITVILANFEESKIKFLYIAHLLFIKTKKNKYETHSKIKFYILYSIKKNSGMNVKKPTGRTFLITSQKWNY